MSSKKEEGAILIITLWILAILTVLSVGVAGRMGLELKLTGFYRDSMKALYLAKAAINRAISEKERDDTPTVDILNEPWANNKDLFDKKNPFIENPENNETTNTYYTVKYTYKETKEDEGTDLYGMMDEASKLNINKIVTGETVDTTRRQQLIDLLNVCQIDDAEAKVDVLIDWMDTNDTVYGSTDKENTRYYADTGVETYSKNSSLESIEELLLIKRFDSTILYGDEKEGKYGIIDYITIYTPDDGRVNINTAPQEVLQVLGFMPGQAVDIINYRKNGPEIGDSDDRPITQDNLNINFFKENIFTEPPENESQINDIITKYLTATSKTFRINVTGQVNKVEKHITCVALIEAGQATFKYWNEQ